MQKEEIYKEDLEAMLGPPSGTPSDTESSTAVIAPGDGMATTAVRGGPPPAG